MNSLFLSLNKIIYDKICRRICSDSPVGLCLCLSEITFHILRLQIRASQMESAEKKNTDSKKKTVQTIHSSKINKSIQTN